jgi:5-methylcytosine-specific restriction protein A
MSVTLETRSKHLAREPYCAACAERGIERQATMVEHIIAVRQGPEIRLDSDNLQSLCWPCHNRKTNRCDGGLACRVALSQVRLRQAEEA